MNIHIKRKGLKQEGSMVYIVGNPEWWANEFYINNWKFGKISTNPLLISGIFFWVKFFNIYKVQISEWFLKLKDTTVNNNCAK